MRILCVVFMVGVVFMGAGLLQAESGVSGSDAPNSKTISINDSLYLQFQYIPAGSFLMGSPEDESGRDRDEGPVHYVILSQPFYLCAHEVTQALWVFVMHENPATFRSLPENEQLPVETVSWNACQVFIHRLGDIAEGQFRLPTEAEWEYACRAGTTSRFYWPEDEGEWVIHRFAWVNSRSFAMPHPVGEKMPNAWGLYDMSGNVWEWCSDWYAPYSEQSQVDPAGPYKGKNKVFRGGSWYDLPNSNRSANRHRHGRDKGYPAIGLRLVWEPEGGE